MRSGGGARLSAPREWAGCTVVCSVPGETPQQLRARLASVPAGCGLAEIRADRIRPDAIGGLVEAAGRAVIVTARRAADGGAFEGSEAERRVLLESALDAGAALVDVEHDSELADLAEGERRGRVILSAHGGAPRGDALFERYREMAARGAGRLKIVPHATAVDESLAVRTLLARAAGDGIPLASFATGRAGVATRVLAPSWGSWATYGACAADCETAPGQLTAEELLDDYDVLGIGAATTLYALIGADVRTSPSPAMHMAAYRELGLDARYLSLDVARLDEVLPLLDGSAGARLSGLAVTMPFKRDLARRCEPRDEVARAAGVVNTVLVARGGWSGYNTDGPAAVQLARQRCELRGARVAVVGAGGTGRAMAAAFKQAGAAVTVFNRHPKRAREAAHDLGVEARSLGELSGAVWEVLLHCTPLGRRGETVLLPSRLGGTLVIDAVYGPRPTPLVEAARARGLAVVDGFELLAAQAVLQFERLTGRRPDPATMIRAGRRFLARMPHEPGAALDAPTAPA